MLNLSNLKICNYSFEDDLLKDVIKQSIAPNLPKNLNKSKEFNDMISVLENFINWNYNTDDYWENNILLIVANHPFWEKILLEWNENQKEYLYYFLQLCLDMSNLMWKLWYYKTRVVKDSIEWVNFIHKPNLSNFIKLKDLIYELIIWESKSKIDGVLQ